MNERARVRPSWWFYVLALALFAAGMSYFVYDLRHGIGHVTDSLAQVVVPGEAQLPLKQGVDYTVFLETESVVNGKIYSAHGSINGLSCKVMPRPGEDAIPMRRPGMATSYDTGGRSGRSFLEFRVLQDGIYKFGCGYDEGAKGPETVVAVGSGVGEGILRTVSTGLLAFFGGIGSAFIIGLVTFLLRLTAKQRQTSASAVPAPPFS